MLFKTIENTLAEVTSLLDQVDAQLFMRPCKELGGATIGQHTRHIIEMFQCLVQQYESGFINYDNRERNSLIETLPDYAVACIQEIKDSMIRPEKKLILIQRIAGTEMALDSNYYRELLYNLEHCIHHQALIKVATLGINNIQLHENFGVAPSTIEYKKQCVQ